MSKILRRRPGWLVLITAILLSACADRGIQLPESQLLRAFERTSGQIAYLGMDGNIYTIDQTGSEQQQITNDTAELPLELVMAYRHFSWSPARDELAYIGFSPDEWSLNVTEIKDTNPRRIFGSNSESPLFLQWTPDGNDLSFLTLTDPALNEGASSITFRSASSSANISPSVLAEGFPLFFSWEPIGGRVLTHIGGARTDNPEARISIITPGGNFDRDLDLPPSNFQAPAWSPTGTQLMMAIEDIQGRNTLVLASIQGQARQTITTFENAIAFSWSPDGERLAYIESDRTRQGVNGQLTVVNPAKPDETFVTEENLVHAFVWSPSGEQLVYFTQELVSDETQDNFIFGIGIHFLDVEEQEVRHLKIGENPFIFQPTPHFRQYLLAFDQYQQGATIWSPDDNYIVIPALNNNQGVILVVPVSGTLEPRPIVDGMMAFWSWR